jgi:hypothetical protein
MKRVSLQDILRVYLDPAEIGADGYPRRWHRPPAQALIEGAEPLVGRENVNSALQALGPFPMSIKDYVREQAGNRCVRCHHPYEKGMGEWSPCDEQCTHEGPVCWFDGQNYYDGLAAEDMDAMMSRVAQWRILTVHHLNGVKHDCRWQNLAALCQRCHLTIQGRVVMERPYWGEHSEWFKPYVAAYYASIYLDEELTREEVMQRLDELLALEHRQERLPDV